MICVQFIHYGDQNQFIQLNESEHQFTQRNQSELIFRISIILFYIYTKLIRLQKKKFYVLIAGTTLS